MKLIKTGFVLIIGIIFCAYIYVKITEPKSYEECKVDFIDNRLDFFLEAYPTTLCADGEEAPPEGLRGCPNGNASADEYAHAHCKHFLED